MRKKIKMKKMNNKAFKKISEEVKDSNKREEVKNKI